VRFGVGDSECFDWIGERKSEISLGDEKQRTVLLTFDDIHNLNTDRLSPGLENISTLCTRLTALS